MIELYFVQAKLADLTAVSLVTFSRRVDGRLVAAMMEIARNTAKLVFIAKYLGFY